jgi:hypothetical protein
LKRQLSKKVDLANKYLKNCSTSLAIQEMQQNIIETPSHPNQNGYYPKNKQQQMLTRMWWESKLVQSIWNHHGSSLKD